MTYQARILKRLIVFLASLLARRTSPIKFAGMILDCLRAYELETSKEKLKHSIDHLLLADVFYERIKPYHVVKSTKEE